MYDQNAEEAQDSIQTNGHDSWEMLKLAWRYWVQLKYQPYPDGSLTNVTVDMLTLLCNTH